jgi:hypothetical protein
MVSPVLNETFTTAGFLVSEMPGTGSRDTVLFDNTAGATDLLVQAGTVYSLESYGSPVVTAKAGGNTGNGTVSAVTPNTTVTQIGAYTVTLLGATTFSVTAPDGSVLNQGTVGTPYINGIAFKLAAGGTPFAAGDTFTVTTSLAGNPAVAAGGSNVGNGAITGVKAITADTAMLGDYLVTFTAATVFSVVAPDGRQLSAGATGTAYADEIGFTITAGATPFVAGDSFTIGVGAGAGYATFFTGASPAAGIIYNKTHVPAGGTKKLTVIARNAEVTASELQFLGTVTSNAKATAIAQLRQYAILAR